MSKYSFSQSERFAVFTTHGPKCYICGCPVDLQTMHVDHIIPEDLLNSKERFETVLRDFDLPKDFDVNSFENWLPSCAPCNSKKGAAVFRTTPLIQMQLDRAADKADRARELARGTVGNATLSRSINTICRASEDTKLTIEHLRPLIESMKKHNPELFEGVVDLYGGRDGGSGGNSLGFATAKRIPARIPLTPFHTIVAEDEWRLMISAPYGTGYVPKTRNGVPPDGSFYCGFCGSLGPWSGARCLSCGHLNDD